jgi:DNA polymerase III delta subunit
VEEPEMPVEGFYYTYGDDTDMLEKKWFPDLQKKYPDATWLRYDATIDDINIGKLVTEYNANDLFSKGKVIVIRNADKKQEEVQSLAEELLHSPVRGSALVLIAGGWNKTTRLGKLAKKSFIVREFSRPEIKPFDMIDALNAKNSAMVLRHSERLFAADYHPLAMFSLIFGHFLLLRQVHERRQKSYDVIARELKQHSFRIKKAMVAFRYWNGEQLDEALVLLGRVDSLLRTWQYDEKMLIQMALIKLTL